MEFQAFDDQTEPTEEEKEKMADMKKIEAEEQQIVLDRVEAMEQQISSLTELKPKNFKNNWTEKIRRSRMRMKETYQRRI